jgi:Protein of unknown function (DUF2516)
MGSFDGYLLFGVHWLVVALGAWAFVDALVRPASAYVAAGKLTKPAWAAITALALLIDYFVPMFSFLWLPAVVGSIVYLVDVRPAVRGMRRRGGSSW